MMFLNKRLLLIIVLMAVLILLGATATDIRLDKKKTGNLAVDDVFFYLQSLVYNGRLVVGDSSPSYGNIPVRDSACWKFVDDLYWDFNGRKLGINIGNPNYNLDLSGSFRIRYLGQNLIFGPTFPLDPPVFHIDGGGNIRKIRTVDYSFPSAADTGYFYRHTDGSVTFISGHSGVINILDGDQITTHVLTFDRGILKTYATQ